MVMPVHLIDSAVPKHEQLRAILLQRCTKELAAGDIMPSERTLMHDYGVSRITVREAVGQLVNEGHVVRVRGKGTFVATRSAHSRLHVTSFRDEMRSLGLDPTTVVLFARLEDPSPDHLRTLRMIDSARACHIRRLHLAEGQPVSVEDGWIDAALVPELVDDDSGTVDHDAVTSHVGSMIDRAEQTVTAAAADSDVATLLGIKRGAPALYVERVSFNGGRPVEQSESWLRCDRYRLTMEVHGRPRPPRP